MNFSIIITLGFYFLLCHQVSSSRSSFLKNQTLSIDKAERVYEKFITKFAKLYLRKTDPRHIMMIGTSIKGFRKTEPYLLQRYPCIICTDLNTCVYPEIFNWQSFVIVFLTDLGKQTLEESFKILSSCRIACKFLFIFEGVISKSDEILSIFIRSITTDANPALVHVNKDGITFHYPVLQENCAMGMKSMVVSKYRTDLRTIYSSVFIPITNWKKCPVNVVSFPYMPKMVMEKKKNGSLTIKGGLDGFLVLLIAHKLNFTIKMRYPTLSDPQNESKDAALLDEVAKGSAEFGIARIRPTHNLTFSSPYDMECLTWAVPRIMNTPKNILGTEFSLKVWIGIGSVLVVSCVVGYIHHTIVLLRSGNQRDVGFSAIILDVISINLGNNVIHVPVSASGKLMLIVCLHYAIVMTTAYKTSFASVLSTDTSTSIITNTIGIINENLEVGGLLYHYNILKDQANDSKVNSKLTQLYIIHNNHSEALHRLKYNQDFAYLARRSTLLYEKSITMQARELMTFNILDECVLKYATVLALRKGSFFLTPVNTIILQIDQSGILQYWNRLTYINDQKLERENTCRFTSEYKSQKLTYIFIFYSSCNLVCILVFFIELLSARLKRRNRQRIIRRNYL